ncbi:MAG: DUF63 family protein [Candidatus Nanohaloarchaea archaeon]|nr:DUF63 family protein [Candidatus Nanohaloarchaea archaeon]
MKRKNMWILASSAVLIAGIALASYLSESVLLFLWEYIWGPIVADANNQYTAVYRGVEAVRNYNVVDTSLYAVLVVITAFGAYNFFQKLGLKVNKSLVFSITPFVIFGEFLRVMDDAAIVSYPYSTLLIFPISGFIIFFVALGIIYLLKKLEDKGTIKDYRKPVLYTSTGLSLIAGAILLRYGLNNGFNSNISGLILTPVILISAVLTLQKFMSGIWPDTFINSSVGMLATASHVLDGSVTAFSIESMGYSEKHVVAEGIIEVTGNAYYFLAVKIAVILAILGMIPREDDREFKLVVLLFIILVGLGPGTRDIVRAILGV